MSILPLERPDGGVLLMCSDVTASRQAQLEVEAQRGQLNYLARVAVLGQFSGALAHELNQPLTAILGNAEAARYMIRGGRPAQNLEPVIDDIIADDERAAAVIRRLRALFKREEARLLPMDAHELISDALSLSRIELIRRHTKASVTIEPNLPPLLVDKVQIQQVLLNLILNACDAMSRVEAARRVLGLDVRSDTANQVCFAVRDNGLGIPPEVKEHLFDAFVTTKPDGLGVGLSISRTIVASHGGRLWAENNADGGATLRFLLPTVSGDRRIG
jgi:C4-dicarboxylate-specific signal transduction histidine kinase